MATELARADRAGEPVTLLFMDLDGFKLVNDSLGHAVGDELLEAVADRLRACVREGDVCARVGGDEFALLLLGDTDPELVAERIIDVLGAGFQIGTHEVFVSVSIGIVSGRGDAETLLSQADVAMYHAKRDATIRHARFEPSMHAALVSRLRLETELRRALEREEFELHYQPIYSLGNGRLVAFEGLLRWRHPTRGLVGPVEFVPVAEQTGLIIEIGRWVLREGARQLSAWTRLAPVTVGVNVATRELAQEGYVDGIREVLDGSFAPATLVLEITEREPLEGVPGVLETLHAVKELGVRIALDDFGTGYSTLVNLSKLPIDIIKIAKEFVDMAEGDQAAGLLAGIVGFGRHLGLETVAEGIERPDQRALLAKLGCNLGQGYLLGRPMPREAATQMLRETAAARSRRRAKAPARPAGAARRALSGPRGA
jgi:diguanylate cyclase (GGDEF)-like protein